MAAQQGGQGGEDKNTYYILWVIALIVFVGGIIWYFLQVQLKQFFIWVKVSELILINYFYELLDMLPEGLPWIGDQVSKSLAELRPELLVAKQLTPNSISLDIAEVLSTSTGEYMRYPVAVLLIILCILVFRLNVQMRLKKKFNMKTLAEQEQVNWPQIQITTKVDLLNQDLDSGPWAMAMSPIQFAKKNKLVTIVRAEAMQNPFSKSLAPEYKIILDKARAERAFAAQLGRTWVSVEAMPPHRRAIFAVFIARGCRDTKVASLLVRQLASSASGGSIDFKGADALWKKHMGNRKVQDMCRAHAFEFTVFISALQFAREDGVLASSDFLWVKPLDRRLWYVINNVGRQTPAVEVGGIFCHWYYEMALKIPLSSPRIDGAVEGLEIAMSELMYIPDDTEKDEILKREETQEPETQEAVE